MIYVVDLDRKEIFEVEKVKTTKSLRPKVFWDGEWVSYGEYKSVNIFNDEESAVKWAIRRAHERQTETLFRLEEDFKVLAFARRLYGDWHYQRQLDKANANDL